jgi:hypothetical protein
MRGGAVRTLVIAATLALVLGCGAGLWALNQSASPLVLPEAQGVSTQWRDANTLLVRYDAPGEPFGWRGALAQRLEQAGWRGRSFTNMGARRPPFVTIWYTRERRMGALLIVERAVFGGDADTPYTAQIELTREVFWGGRRLLGR